MRRQNVVVMLAMTAAVGTAGLWIVFPPSRPTYTPYRPPPLAKIEIHPESLTIGTVPEQPSFEHTLTIHNSNSIDVADLVLDASCNCTSIAPGKVHLEPNGTAQVQLTIDLTHLPPSVRNSTEFEWPLNLALLAKTSDGEGRPHSRRWNLTGIVQRYIVTDPPAIQLSGANEIIQDAVPVMAVQVRSRVPLAHLTAELNSANGHVSIMPNADGYMLEYARDDTSQVGEFANEISLNAITRGGERLPKVVIPVTGKVVPPFRLTPGEVVFAPALIGQELQQTVAVTSPTGAPFRVVMGDVLPSHIDVELPERDNATSSQQIRVALQLAEKGNHIVSIPLSIQPLTNGASAYELDLVVRAFGLRPGDSVAQLEETE